MTPDDNAAPASGLTPASVPTPAAKTTSVLRSTSAPQVTTVAWASLWSAAGPWLAALLLGIACVAWSAAPFGHGGLARMALAVSIVAVTAGALRLALAGIPQPENVIMLPGYLRAWLLFRALLRGLAWEETAVVGVLWLEVQHPVRPWHSAVLGAGLTAYLLVVHIAESGANPAPLLRRLWKSLAVGACLLALGAGFAMVPAVTFGTGAAILRVLAAAALVAAIVLVLPS